MMMTEQLKTFSGKANQGLKTAGEAAKKHLKTTGEAARSGANSLYTTAMNNPRATAAVVLGAGVAAALIWMASRNGTFSALHKKVMARVKRVPAKRTRSRARAATS